MDYSKVNKDELIFIVKAAYEYKDAALAEHYFNQVIAKNEFIDSIKDEIHSYQLIKELILKGNNTTL